MHDKAAMPKNRERPTIEKVAGHLFAAALFMFSLNGPALSQTLGKATSAIEGKAAYPLVPGAPEKLQESGKAQIFQYDSSALGSRVPLMLVHGGGGESRP